MSYSVHLSYPDKECKVPSHKEGATYNILGGTSDADMDITYNYGGYIRAFLNTELGLRWLHGRTGQETIGPLTSAVKTLARLPGGTKKSSNYWAETPGNVHHALKTLLEWATLHPEATWSIH